MSKCKGCERSVLYVKDTEGKTQILDPSAPVFELWGDDNKAQGTKLVKRDRNAWVSHFATCHEATDFSRSHREKFARFQVLEDGAKAAYAMAKVHCIEPCAHPACSALRRIRSIFAAPLGNDVPTEERRST